MSCFSSYFCKCEKPEVDVALDVINESELRIGCMKCEKELFLKITDEQSDILRKFWKH